MSVRDKLNQFNTDFGKAEEKHAGEFVPIPDGDYEIVIENNEIITSKTSGNPGFKLSTKIIAGEFKGRLVTSTSWITENTIPYFKGMLARLEVKINKLEDLLDVKLTGKRYIVNIVSERNDNDKVYPRIRDVISKVSEKSAAF